MPTNIPITYPKLYYDLFQKTYPVINDNDGSLLGTASLNKTYGNLEISFTLAANTKFRILFREILTVE